MQPAAQRAKCRPLPVVCCRARRRVPQCCQAMPASCRRPATPAARSVKPLCDARCPPLPGTARGASFQAAFVCPFSLPQPGAASGAVCCAAGQCVQSLRLVPRTGADARCPPLPGTARGAANVSCAPASVASCRGGSTHSVGKQRLYRLNVFQPACIRFAIVTGV